MFEVSKQFRYPTQGNFNNELGNEIVVTVAEWGFSIIILEN